MTETLGMDDPSSVAAQGEQASEPHHADGSIFTGQGPRSRVSRHPTQDTVTSSPHDTP